MKVFTGVMASCIGVFFAFLLQECLPALGLLHGGRFVLVPTIFCYAAMVLPFPAMLGLAFYTGLLTERMYLPAVDGQVEIALGWHIVFYVMFGIIAQGLQGAMMHGRWWPFVLLSALGTSALLFLELVMICFRREGFVFDSVGLWRIFVPGFLAAIFAPVLYLGILPFTSLFPRHDAIPREY